MQQSLIKLIMKQEPEVVSPFPQKGTVTKKNASTPEQFEDCWLQHI